MQLTKAQLHRLAFECDQHDAIQACFYGDAINNRLTAGTHDVELLDDSDTIVATLELRPNGTTRYL